jgi:hypothetical protein
MVLASPVWNNFIFPSFTHLKNADCMEGGEAVKELAVSDHVDQSSDEMAAGDERQPGQDAKSSD